MRNNKRAGLVAGATAVGLLGVGVAFAAIPSNGVISGCYAKNGGDLRVVDTAGTACKPGETSLAWNQTGPQGPAGPQGATGAQGPAGPGGLPTVSLVKRDFVSDRSITRFLPLDLPAGNYFVQAKLNMTSPSYGACDLVSGPGGLETYHDVSSWDNGAKRVAVVLMAKVTLTAADTVQLRCGNGFGDLWEAERPVLSAIPLA